MSFFSLIKSLYVYFLTVFVLLLQARNSVDFIFNCPQGRSDLSLASQKIINLYLSSFSRDNTYILYLHVISYSLIELIVVSVSFNHQSHFFFFLELHLWHMEVPWLGAELVLRLPAYTTDTARQDPNRICDLHHNSRQCRILNTLSQGQGLNPHPHGNQLSSSWLSHNGNFLQSNIYLQS